MFVELLECNPDDRNDFPRSIDFLACYSIPYKPTSVRLDIAPEGIALSISGVERVPGKRGVASP